MRLPSRAIVLTSSALVLVAGAASGCGGGGDNGTVAQTTTIAATTTTATATTTTEPRDGQAVNGAELFSTNCQSCHGADGADGAIGPNLQTSSAAENLAQVTQQVRNGGGAMPPFSDVLSDEEIDVVARYVVEQLAPKE